MECAIEDNTSLRVASFACYLDTPEDTVLHKISAQDTSVVLNASKTKSLAPKPTSNVAGVGLTNLRVDSFSYLNNVGDHGFVFSVPKPVQNPTSNTFTFPKEIPKDGEISVFGADRYFNMMKVESHEGSRQEVRKQGPINLPCVGSNPRIRPSSIYSEASSMNSRTALITNPRTHGPDAKQRRKAFRRGFFFGLGGCRGPCFEKKDVCIKRAEEGSLNPNPNRPTAPVQVRNPGMQKQPLELVANNIEESRISIEVFGSGATSKGDVAANLERKLSMLTWDAIPKIKQTLPAGASTVRTSTVCDDMASDASSDLFEIENVSSSMYPMLTAKPGPAVVVAEADDMSGCPSPLSHYAPSEASIQWSVVTASAADFSSVLSDYNEVDHASVSRNNSVNVKKVRNGGVQHEVKPGGPVRAGGLLGCKSQKAVDVAGNHVRVV